MITSVVAGSIASPEDIYNSLNATLTRVGANIVQSFTHTEVLLEADRGEAVTQWMWMGNHLLMESPGVNLSAGMRELPRTFSQAWNGR